MLTILLQRYKHTLFQVKQNTCRKIINVESTFKKLTLLILINCWCPELHLKAAFSGKEKANDRRQFLEASTKDAKSDGSL